MAWSGEKRRDCGRLPPDPPREHAIAAIARRQHNVIALRQLHGLGLSGSAVRSRVASGRLHRIHAGVYAIGHSQLTANGRWMAAVLACGDEAVLSHRSAAALWGLRPDTRATCDVTSRRRSGRDRNGIVAHTGNTLMPADITTIDGIPCTSLARTLLDLAEDVTRRELERAIDRAEVLRLLDMHAINDVLGRANGRHGAPPLWSVITDHHAGSTLTQSQLEERFLAICRTAEVPQPEVNVWMALPDNELNVDFLWRKPCLIVETDGYTTHATRQSFERDRARDQRLTLAGYRVVRFTWRQLTREPDRVGTTLRTLLGHTAGKPPPGALRQLH